MTIFIGILIVGSLAVIGGLAFLLTKLQKKLDEQVQLAAATLQQKDAQHVQRIVEMQTQLESYYAYYTDEVQKFTDQAQLAYDQRLKELETEAEQYRNHYEGEGRRIAGEAVQAVQEMSAELESLRKYAGLRNAEVDVAATCAQALQEAENLKAEARLLLEASKNTVKSEQVMAQKKVEEFFAEADALLRQATKDAAGLIANAEKQAQEIAGEAYEALREKETLEAAAKAIYNVIEGYGDRYVLPTRGMLDELAEGFGHTAAGQSFKMAKARSEQMVLEGQAATCDYAEEYRRNTAIRFVIDAFNGRVDSTLAKAKHDNLGTLEQQVRDAFSLVNLNGEAFRFARILPEYLESRLAELHWATLLQELKRKEREEQRAIQEQIREEEKVRREQEKLLRDVAREEIIAREALEKARQEAAVAIGEERIRLEAELEAMRQKLIEAETNTQRTKSLAEQTKAGHVYVISNIGSFGENVYKIGMTRRQDPWDRVWELSDASVPFDFDVHAIISTSDAPALEYALHEKFGEHRMNQVNLRKEFFRVSLTQIRAIVELTDGLHNIQWTMVAEAQEFKESIALRDKKTGNCHN